MQFAPEYKGPACFRTECDKYCMHSCFFFTPLFFCISENKSCNFLCEYCHSLWLCGFHLMSTAGLRWLCPLPAPPSAVSIIPWPHLSLFPVAVDKIKGIFHHLMRLFASWQHRCGHCNECALETVLNLLRIQYKGDIKCHYAIERKKSQQTCYATLQKKKSNKINEAKYFGELFH